MSPVIDTNSDTWRAIRLHVDARLARLRQQNEGDLDPEKTAKLRGRIAELKELLTLAQPAPALMADEQ